MKKEGKRRGGERDREVEREKAGLPSIINVSQNRMTY